MALAQRIGVSAEEIHLRSHVAAQSYRTRFERKPSGGLRKIQAPFKDLKRLQRKLLRYLVVKCKPHRSATAGIKGASIVRHAQPHRGKRHVLTIDIHKFFDEVNYGQVEFALTRNGISLELSRLITSLTTRGKCLPQGAPTSQFIANLVLFGLDRRLHKFARQHQLRYTRYVDDIALSGTYDFSSFIPEICGLISRAGFRPAPKKTRSFAAGTAAEITGLEVCDEIRVLPRFVRATERMLRMASVLRSDTNPKRSRLHQHCAKRLRGRVAFVRMVQPKLGRQLQSRLREMLALSKP